MYFVALRYHQRHRTGANATSSSQGSWIAVFIFFVDLVFLDLVSAALVGVSVWWRLCCFTVLYIVHTRLCVTARLDVHHGQLLLTSVQFVSLKAGGPPRDYHGKRTRGEA